MRRDCFSGDQLLPAVLRFLTDPTQTPNSRVKVATLTFIAQIADTAEPSALNSSAGSALARLIDWTNDMKSQDVRRHAQNAVISLYNLNTPQVTMILSDLPKPYQVSRIESRIKWTLYLNGSLLTGSSAAACTKSSPKIFGL